MKNSKVKTRKEPIAGTLVEIPLSQIHTDPAGEMMCNSESLKPYMDYYKAALTRGDTETALTTIAKLPLNKRYVSRVVECLDWALADYDGETVQLDLPYLPNLEETKEKLQERILQLRFLLDDLG
jgi:hypothetical protein